MHSFKSPKFEQNNLIQFWNSLIEYYFKYPKLLNTKYRYIFEHQKSNKEETFHIQYWINKYNIIKCSSWNRNIQISTKM